MLIGFAHIIRATSRVGRKRRATRSTGYQRPGGSSTETYGPAPALLRVRLILFSYVSTTKADDVR